MTGPVLLRTVPNYGEQEPSFVGIDALGQALGLIDITVNLSPSSADVGAPIQAAIDQLARAGGGRIKIPAGAYNQQTPLLIGNNNIRLIGAGGGSGTVSGIPNIQASAGTRLKWTGAPGATMVQFKTPLNAVKQWGGGLEGIMLDGNSFNAGVGLQLLTWSGGYFRDVLVYSCSQDHFLFSVADYNITQSAADTQRNLFVSCFASTLGGANTANGWRLTGGSSLYNANTSLNRFFGCGAYVYTGVPLLLENSDDNWFWDFSGSHTLGPNMQPLTITAITRTNPAVVTYTGVDTDVSFASGSKLFIGKVVGMTQVNGHYYTIANLDKVGKTFQLSGIDSTGFTAYTSGGKADARLPGIVFGSSDQDSGALATCARYNYVYATPSLVFARASQTNGTSSFSNLVFGQSTTGLMGDPWIESGGGGASDSTLYYSDSDGRLNIKNLNVKGIPTVATGLVSGDVWSNAGILTVVP